MVKLFGTDGIRGTANQYPMTAAVALTCGAVAGHLFKRTGHRNKVVIAKDTRLSGYMLENALTAGFISVGVDVILVGPMPTPSVPMLIKSLRADLGIMISASHNPYHDNGMKFFNHEGYKLSDKVEAELQRLILNNEFQDYLVAPDLLGKGKRLDDAQGRYIEHVKRTFPKGIDLSGIRIVLDCANGAAYNLAPNIFAELGADVIKIGVQPDGFNINLNCGSTCPQNLANKVIETRADIGIALDGDADRVVISDELGHIVHGDCLIGLIAKRMLDDAALKGNAIVVTQMSNGGLEDYIKGLGLNLYRTPVGDRYVAEKMRDIGCNFGGEQSGHIIFSDYSPTGDGIIAALEVLATLVLSKKKMSKLVKPFNINPQIIKNIKYVGGNPLDDQSIASNLEALQEQIKNLRIFIRKSGTEKLIRVMVEGRSMETINKAAAQIETLLLKG